MAKTTEHTMSESENSRTGTPSAPQQQPCIPLDPMHNGHPGSRSSEPYLDKNAILEALAIRPGQIIVDAGCGSGYMTRLFARALGGAGRVYAIDRTAPEIPDDEETPASAVIYPLTADITTVIPLPSGFVDLIYLSNVFHIFSEDQVGGFNRQVRRLLKPGGRLAIVDLVKRPTPIGPPLDMRRSPQELQGLIDLAPAGLFEVGEYFYLQLFGKKD
jgi:SAM-dependent methyltransferase